MTPRERMLAGVVLGVVILGGAVFLFHLLVLGPIGDQEKAIEALRTEVEQKHERVHQIQAELPRLERWKQLSLPPDVDLAQREYERYLSELLQESGISVASVTVIPKQPDLKSGPTLAGKGTVYTKLPYTVQLRNVNLASLVGALERFYRTGLLHQVKNLSIQRPLTTGPQQRPGELDITLTVEALIVNGIRKRTYLLGPEQRLVALEAAAGLRGGITGLALVPWILGPGGPRGPGVLAEPPRQYAAITAKNIFYGAQQQQRAKDETDVTKYVRLVRINADDRKTEAWLYDRWNRRYYPRVRVDRGFDQFTIRDSQNEELFTGKVLRIDERDMIFRVKDKLYSMHVGDSIQESMKNELSTERKKELGLIPADKTVSQAK